MQRCVCAAASRCRRHGKPHSACRVACECHLIYTMYILFLTDLPAGRPSCRHACVPRAGAAVGELRALHQVASLPEWQVQQHAWSMLQPSPLLSDVAT